MGKPVVSLYLDTRRVLSNGKFRVRLRVFFTLQDGQVQRLYNTGKSASRSEWDQIKSGSVRGDLRSLRSELITKEKEANDIIGDVPYISPETFDALFTGKRARTTSIKPLFEELINKMKANDQVSSVGLFQNTIKALTKYGGNSLTLNMIDVDFLRGFERWMVKVEDNSISTVGFYLRNLRTVFNMAIERHIVPAEVYPFGRKKYVIPTSRNIKRALSRSDKDLFISYLPIKPAEKKAHFAWLFSYYCNGMNFTDMANLKGSDIRKDTLVFVRRKSATTERETRPQIIILRDELLGFVKDRRSDERLFDILSDGDSATVAKAKVRQWIKTTNEHLAQICSDLGIERITTKSARHTAATMLIRAGADVHYVKDALGHSSISTTEKYLGSLDMEEQRRMTAML